MRAAAIFSVGFIVGVALEWAFMLWQECIHAVAGISILESQMTKRDVMPPARDGKTLSDERRIDELLREFQMACEDAAEFNADSIRASAKHRAILRNELRSELLAVAALRAQLADARVELKTVVDSVDDALLAMREPMTLGEARKGRAILTSYSVRRAIAAARAASGEDASR